MKIEMLKTTNYLGVKVAGKIYEDIPSDVANRWCQRGIATEVKVKTLAELEKEGVAKGGKYSPFKAKQLYEYCLERKIEVEPRQLKEYYIDVLEKNDAAIVNDAVPEDEEEKEEENV